jgi:hypothetical protein
VTAPAVNINAFVAAVDAAVTAAGVPFGDSNKPTDFAIDKPYAVGYFDGGQITDRTMRYRDGLWVHAMIHSYGLSPDSVRIGRRKTLSALFSLAGTSQGGWLVHTPVHQVAMAIDRDDRTIPTLYWQSDEFSIRLTPA